MKTRIAMMLALFLLLVGLMGCDDAKLLNTSEPEISIEEDQSQDGTQPQDEDTQITEHLLVQLDIGDIVIALPDGWKISSSGGVSDTFEDTYDFQFLSPSNEKSHGLISILRMHDYKPEELYTHLSERLDRLLPSAVEDSAEIIDVIVKDGIAMYAILTDASLVGITPPEDEYLYLASYQANYSDFVVIATIFTDDLNSESFLIMLDALSTIESIEDQALNI